MMGAQLVYAAMLTYAAAAITNFADVPCGRVSRIVGGQNATQGEFPWLVSVRLGSSHHCGGTLVTSKWVLTAAHCLCRGKQIVDAGAVRVIVGAHDLRNARRPPHPVARLVVHSHYSCHSHHHDVAMLLLRTSVDWASSVRPACFPGSSASTFAGDEASVAGWGWTNEDYNKGVQSQVLQKVTVSVLDNSECQQWFTSQGKKLRVLESQLCAGFEAGGKDACQADSGGPLMLGGGGLVVGVVSAGIGCGRPRLPGLYSRVSYFLDWVSDTIVKTEG